jgi:hypothetical protein
MSEQKEKKTKAEPVTIPDDELRTHVVERLIYNLDLKEANAENIAQKIPTISADAWKSLKRGVRWMVSHAVGAEKAENLFIEDAQFDRVREGLGIRVG